ncbi:DUF4064 domain-containing protein [Salinicoccus albus]|uniref:DUF4064 domain-containing protein n=1 Tax=Salinicoccus albus TaxID=418756 RepID=UPI00036418E0|nr:DUF4064 domain-containing protein [Salinicoccus albus]
MANKSYKQTVEPVSRIAERIFGWIAWAGLLVITVLLLFFALVMVNDPNFIEQFRQAFIQSMEQQMQGQSSEEAVGVSSEEMADMIVGWLNSSWIFALYLALPLILGLFGLITMRRRILSGFLLLITAILTAPLVFFIITGLIPLFFVIAAILLFVRKDRVINHDEFEHGGGEARRDEFDAPGQRDDGESLREDRSRRQDGPFREDQYRDDTVTYERSQSPDSGTDENNMEETRQFRAIDADTDREYRKESNSEAQSEAGRYVDSNLDSQETTEPVTEEEYTRSGGTSGFSEEAEREDDSLYRESEDRRRESRMNNEYGYGEDASTERRRNVDRRNNDEL